MTDEELVLEIQKGNEVNDNLEQLFNQCKGVILKAARPYFSKCESDDLLQESFIALRKGAFNFKPDGSAKFSTFIFPYIQNACIVYSWKERTPVHIPNNALDLVRRWWRFRDRHKGEQLTRQAIKQGMKISDVQMELLEQALMFLDAKSIQEIVGSENDKGHEITLEDVTSDLSQYSEAVESDPELESKMDALMQNLLTNGMNEVLHKRFWEDKNCTQIAEEMHTAGHQIRVMERDAFKRLKNDPDIRKIHDQYAYDGGLAYGSGVSRNYLLDRSTSTTELIAMNRIELEERERERQRKIHNDFIQLQQQIRRFRAWMEAELTDKQKEALWMLHHEKLSKTAAGERCGVRKQVIAEREKAALKRIRANAAVMDLSKAMLEVLTRYGIRSYSKELLRLRDFLMVVIKG